MSPRSKLGARRIDSVAGSGLLSALEEAKQPLLDRPASKEAAFASPASSPPPSYQYEPSLDATSARSYDAPSSQQRRRRRFAAALALLALIVFFACGRSDGGADELDVAPTDASWSDSWSSGLTHLGDGSPAAAPADDTFDTGLLAPEEDTAEDLPVLEVDGEADVITEPEDASGFVSDSPVDAEPFDDEAPSDAQASAEETLGYAAPTYAPAAPADGGADYEQTGEDGDSAAEPQPGAAAELSSAALGPVETAAEATSTGPQPGTLGMDGAPLDEVAISAPVSTTEPLDAPLTESAAPLAEPIAAAVNDEGPPIVQAHKPLPDGADASQDVPSRFRVVVRR